MDEQACYFNSSATIDDGSCDYFDCQGVCAGDNGIRLNNNGSIWYNIDVPIYGFQFDIEGEDIEMINIENIIYNDLLDNSCIYTDNTNYDCRIKFMIFNIDGTPLFENSSGRLLKLSEDIDGLDIYLKDIFISGFKGEILEFDNLNDCP